MWCRIVRMLFLTQSQSIETNAKCLTHVPVVSAVATKLCWDFTDSYLARKRNSKTDQNDCFLIKLQSSSRASRRGSSLLTIGITWMTLEWILHGEVFLGNKRWLSHFHFYSHFHFSIVIYIFCVFFVLDFHIGLIVTVFDAILMSRQTCEKLQCLYEYEL